MRGFTRKLIWVLALLSTSFSACLAETYLKPTDSQQSLEATLAVVLQQTLGIETRLIPVNKNPNDLQLIMVFDKDTDRMPKVSAIIDSRIIKRTKDNQPQVQALIVSASFDRPIKPEQRNAALSWANQWNLRALPLKIATRSDRVIATDIILTTRSNPVSTAQFIDRFLTLIRATPMLHEDAQKSGLIDKEG